MKVVKRKNQSSVQMDPGLLKRGGRSYKEGTHKARLKMSIFCSCSAKSRTNFESGDHPRFGWTRNLFRKARQEPAGQS